MMCIAQHCRGFSERVHQHCLQAKLQSVEDGVSSFICPAPALEQPASHIHIIDGLMRPKVHVQGPDQASDNLVGLAEQATSAVPPSEAAEVWSTAFKALSAQHLPLDSLLANFIRMLSSSAAGPVRVRAFHLLPVYVAQVKHDGSAGASEVHLP